jgi:hypothetical protein
MSDLAELLIDSGTQFGVEARGWPPRRPPRRCPGVPTGSPAEIGAWARLLVFRIVKMRPAGHSAVRERNSSRLGKSLERMPVLRVAAR